jgi:hypothetical protein
VVRFDHERVRITQDRLATGRAFVPQAPTFTAWTKKLLTGALRG